MSSRARRPSVLTLVLGSIYRGCSGSARFTCFEQATIGLLVLSKQDCEYANAYSANIEFNVSAHWDHLRERKSPTENSNRAFLISHRPKQIRSLWLPQKRWFREKWNLLLSRSESLFLIIAIYIFIKDMCLGFRIWGGSKDFPTSVSLVQAFYYLTQESKFCQSPRTPD